MHNSPNSPGSNKHTRLRNLILCRQRKSLKFYFLSDSRYIVITFIPSPLPQQQIFLLKQFVLFTLVKLVHLAQDSTKLKEECDSNKMDIIQRWISSAEETAHVVPTTCQQGDLHSSRAAVSLLLSQCYTLKPYRERNSGKYSSS